MKKILFIFFFLYTYSSFAQIPNLDSINRLPDDTIKLNLYIDAARYFRNHNQKTEALKSANLCKKYLLRNKTSDRKIAGTNKQIGTAYEVFSIPDSAEYHYRIALTHYKKSKYKLGESAVLLDLGILYFTKGEFEKSIDYLEKAKTLGKNLKFTQLEIQANNNLGNIYFSMRKFNKAAQTFRTCVKLGESTKDQFTIGTGLLNLSRIMVRLDILDSAMFFTDKAIIELEKSPYHGELSEGYELKGIIYRMSNNYRASLENYMKCMELKYKLNVQPNNSIYQNIGALYAFMGKEKESLAYFDTAHSMIKQSRIPTEIISFYLNYGQILAMFKKYEDAYKYLHKSYLLRDSLMSDDKFAEIEEIRKKHEIERAEDQIRTEESVKQAEERAKLESEAASLKQRNTIIISGVLFILMVISIFSVMLFKRVKISRRQNKIISSQRDEVVKQKHLVEEKQHEIIDSIQYAKRLQDAILPSESDFSNIGSDRFVLYLPKDIVAGDFYWVEKHEDHLLVASADCTGHGVPGAMVSVICSNALNKAVVEERVLEPANILNRVREILIKRFSKSGEQVKDGMDISLVSLSVIGTAGKQSLQWAGANNPLWIIRKGAESIEEIKPDKQPVGYSYDMKPFTNHQISLEKGDTIYLLTDGYQDQFGGITANEYLQASMKAKKFKSSSLKNLLLSIQHQTMEEQKATLIKTLNDWKKDIEQIDDISIVGIRI